jgi:multisubunit Na+/H+ antiporter MnhB subunit
MRKNEYNSIQRDTQRTSKKGRKTMMMMIVLAALVAALLGVGLAYFGLNYNFNFSDWWFDVTYNYKHK